MEDYTITIDLNGRKGQVILPGNATESELNMMKDFLCKAVDTRIENAKHIRLMANPLQGDIGDFDISVRLYNVLKRCEVNTVADVLAHSKSEIMTMRNMGRKAYEECIETFGKYGEFKKEEGQEND